MNLSELDATIREIEAKLAQYKADSPLDHSTPRAPKHQSTGLYAGDSGITTMKSVTRPNLSTSEHGDQRKLVKFESHDEKYDMSKYLPRNEQSQTTPALHRSIDDVNVTTRRKARSSTNEQHLPQSQNDQANRSAMRVEQPKRMKVKPATYDGTTSWLDFKSHFEACAKLGQWSDEEKGLYLSVSLRGLAQGILGNLNENEQLNYSDLTRALSDRFAPPNQMELYIIQLRERQQKASETLPELGENIRRLTNLAYPTIPCDVRETLAKDKFIDALASSEMRLRIKQARPLNLTDAVRHAVELEAYFKA